MVYAVKCEAYFIWLNGFMAKLLKIASKAISIKFEQKNP